MSDRIQPSRLADQAYEVLKNRILTRQLLPGQRLSVPALAEELQLSRSPIREAVLHLVQEGLCTERPHQGAVVASADIPALVELYQVRAELEGLSAELAAASDDPTVADELEAIHLSHGNAYESGASAEVIKADMEFHRRILQAAGNAELVRVLEPILQRMSLAMLVGEQSWRTSALAEHRAILESIQHGRAREARSRMAQHILRVRSSLMSKTEENE